MIHHFTRGGFAFQISLNFFHYVILTYGELTRRAFVAFNSSDGRVNRSSASEAVDSGLIPSRVKPMTLKLVFTAFLLDAQRQRDSVENKLASLFVVSLGKALEEIPPFCCCE